MRVERLRLRGFRNLKDLTLEPSPRLNWILGENGQGKTNLLEAIYAGARAKSFRPYASRADWIARDRANGATTSVFMDFTDGRLNQFSTEIRHGETWQILLNEKRANPQRVRSLVPIVAFSPDDHALLRGEPELRRDYLDEVLCDVAPGYVESTDRYAEALKSRNRVLRGLRERGQRVASAELEAWTDTLARAGVEVMVSRRELMPRLSSVFEVFASRLLRSDAAEPRLKLVENYSGADDVKSLGQAIRAQLFKDLDTGWTHAGPHRDDLLVEISGMPAKGAASQGQSRLLALALKWAHAAWVHEERRDPPIILVDDFSSEVDASRRAGLLNILQETQGQVFITGTELSKVDSGGVSDYKILTVHAGDLSIP